MGMKQCAVALLAAGKGTRLKLDGPKALAPLLGKKLIDYSLEVFEKFTQTASIQPHIGVVVGHEREKLENYLAQNKAKVETCLQAEQKGTGHALQCFFEELPHMWELPYTLVACVDTPLITEEIYSEMFNKMNRDDSIQGIAVTFETPNPKGYGRIKKGDVGFQIIEEKDASASDQLIKEVNSGLYLLKTSYIKEHLYNLNNKNKSGEFYLTDLFREDQKVETLLYRDESFFKGVNDQIQLEDCRTLLLKRKIASLRDQGVLIVDSKNIEIEWDVEVGNGSILEPNIHLKGNTQIGQNVSIEPGVVIKNSKIGNNVNILAYSYLEECEIGESSQIGPFARLRPQAHIGSENKIGNFVEIKKSQFAKGVKVSHLSYVGDSEIGENSNVGCGFISCNYDGSKKHITKIGKNCFIGSDCQSVAPVEIGDGSFVAAGSTITKNVPADSFAIARSKQINKEGQAKRFIKKKD
ncbi:MAG: bifunctional UDP-N-acetylglucosamine diphosphorylase/glucosamine-1-phosphate N-acetyltransferase GlmU [Halobacteriovoraceae bacterium]|nr:bifunctional UDP-N-acetylglucosamine diphosphorylase/glucosamine-1-phosphate N-acetyltransferase GlmU [Halobacteriovoraceae bacterium]